MRVIREVEAEVTCSKCKRVLAYTADDVQVCDASRDYITCVCGTVLYPCIPKWIYEEIGE